MQRYLIHTDGACSGNPGPGGWAFLVAAEGFDGEDGRFSTSGAVEETTNQRMELQAVLEALGWIKENGVAPFTVVVYTDSKYVKDGMQEWLPRWKKNGWQTREKTAVKNRDLWKQIDLLAARMQVSWEWTESHAEDEDNILVDRLASKEAKNLKKELQRKRFLVLVPVKGTKRTAALLGKENCVRVFTSREDAEVQAEKHKGRVVDAETLADA